MNLDTLIAEALAHHQSGRLDDAERLYRQVLAQVPNHAAVLNMLGAVAHQKGDDASAVALMQRSIEFAPTEAHFHNNLGEVWRRQGALDRAAACFQRVIELSSDHAPAWNNLGLVHQALGHSDSAHEAFRRAVQFDPNYLEALGNLARVAESRDPAEAERCFRRAIALMPGSASLHVELAHLVLAQGRQEEAFELFQKAVALEPDHGEAIVILGSLLQRQGRYSEAAAALGRAMALNPNNPVSQNNMGVAHLAMGELDQAVAHFRRAQELRPDYQHARDNLLMSLHYDPRLTLAEVYAAHRQWGERWADPLLPQPPRVHSNARDPERRLRIGYVSSDFRDHAVAFFIEPVLERHDRGQFEITCYGDVGPGDEITPRFRQLADRWREVSNLSDEQLAALIAQDGIDILVDLSGHTQGNRLPAFARKPAPVQITWIGYPGPSGMRAIDYWITDAHCDPAGQTEPHIVERLLRPASTFTCYRAATPSPPIVPLPARSRGHVTFGSFNFLAKLNDSVLDTWSDILRAVPSSKLLICAHWDQGVQQKFRSRFVARSIDPARLDFRAGGSLQQFLGLHNEVDIVLDTFPFTGHTVSLHALWMGCPVITLAGDRHVARRGVSILSNLGMQEWIAGTRERFVAIATELANDWDELEQLRMSLRERMNSSPLMDAVRCTRELEVGYREVWGKWCTSGPRGSTELAEV